MKLQINKAHEIVAYVTDGDVDNSIDYQGTLPDDFEANFKSSYYLLQNNEIIVNPNYEEPVIIDPGPSQTQQQLAQVVYQQMMTTQDVTTLQTQNAQMAYQLMMQQGGKA